MSFNYKREYKNRIRTCVQLIKTTKETKNTGNGKMIRELKKECLCLLEQISEFGYNPRTPNCTFFVTESRAGFNKTNLSQLEQLHEIKAFLTHHQKNPEHCISI